MKVLLCYLVTIGLCAAYNVPTAPLDKLYNRFYYNLQEARECVTLNSATGPIGCSTKGEEASAMYLVEKDGDVGGATSYTDSSITIVVDLCYPTCGASWGTILAKFNNSAHVRGVVVAKDAPAPASDSSGPKSSWNPSGTNANWELYTFSVIVLDASSPEYKRLRENAAYNKRNSMSYPQYWIQQQYHMESMGMTTMECLSRNKCKPIGGFSAWASTQPLQQLSKNDDTSFIVAMTSISSTAFFHADNSNYEVPSALSTVAPVVALASAMEAISRYPAFRSPQSRPLLFSFFHGEPYDLMGSRRFVKELTSFNCTKPGTPQEGWACMRPYYWTTNFTKLNLTQFEYLLYVDQVGTNKGQAYMHNDNTRSPNSARQQEMTSAFKAQGAMPATSKSGTLPPSSLPAFFESSLVPQDAGALLLSDYDGLYSDPYYESSYDGAVGINAESVGDKATIIVRALAQLSLINKTVPADLPAVNITLVKELIECFTTNSACETFAKYLPASGSVNYYPSVFFFTDVMSASMVSAFLQNYMADLFASARGTNCSTPCKRWEECVAGQCLTSDSYLHHAYSPAIEYDYDSYMFKTVSNGPAWAESNWDDKTGARTYLMDSVGHEAGVLVSGILSTIVSAVYFYFLHEQYVLAWVKRA
jgi:hypothetical protein